VLWRQNSQNSDTTAPSGRELYHLQFSLQAASPETFGYTLVYVPLTERFSGTETFLSQMGQTVGKIGAE
jgi:hypothetical protein